MFDKQGRVKCMECGNYYKSITGMHLQKHGLDPHQYKEKHGNPPMVGQAFKDSMHYTSTYGNQKVIRILQDLEPELELEYEKEKERLAQQGIKYSWNEYLNHLLAKGLKTWQEEKEG